MRAMPILLLLALAACNSPIADRFARDAARATVNPILAQRFPGIPLQPATDCVIESATAPEILTLAGAATRTATATGPDPQATRLVLEIATRPQTIECLAVDGLPAILTTL